MDFKMLVLCVIDYQTIFHGWNCWTIYQLNDIYGLHKIDVTKNMDKWAEEVGLDPSSQNSVIIVAQKQKYDIAYLHQPRKISLFLQTTFPPRLASENNP